MSSHIRLVDKNRHSYRLRYYTIEPGTSCQMGMTDLRAHELTRSNRLYILSSCFRQTVVETVEISKFSVGGDDLEAQSASGTPQAIVVIASRRQNLELTAGFRKPKLLDSKTPFGTLLNMYAVVSCDQDGDGDGDGGSHGDNKHALLISNPISNRGWLYMLGLVMGSAGALGVVLGVVLKSVEIGLAAGFGWIGVVGVVEAYALFFASTSPSSSS